MFLDDIELEKILDEIDRAFIFGDIAKVESLGRAKVYKEYKIIDKQCPLIRRGEISKYKYRLKLKREEKKKRELKAKRRYARERRRLKKMKIKFDAWALEQLKTLEQ